MFSKKSRLNGLKLTKVMVMVFVVALSTAGVPVVHATEYTSGNWNVYYNSPGSLKSTDYVRLTARSDWTYTAKCSVLSNSKLHVDFTDNPIYSTGSTSLTFTSTGTKSFKFNESVCTSTQCVDFKLVRSSGATGSANGSAYKK